MGGNREMYNNNADLHYGQRRGPFDNFHLRLKIPAVDVTPPPVANATAIMVVDVDVVVVVVPHDPIEIFVRLVDE